MITQKYNYKPLTRKHIEGKRFYTMDGEDYLDMPSVTTILDITKPAESKEALDNWRKRVGIVNATAITHEASSRGTRMHKYLEDYIKTDIFSVPGTNPYAQHANKMAKQIVDNGLSKVNEYWGVEVSLCHPNIYAGTTDLVGVHDGTPAIIDFKQSNKLKKREWIEDYFMQLTSYAEAHNILYGTEIRKGVVMMCTKDFQYQEFIIEGDEFDMWRKKWWHRVEQYFLLDK